MGTRGETDSGVQTKMGQVSSCLGRYGSPEKELDMSCHVSREANKAHHKTGTHMEPSGQKTGTHMEPSGQKTGTHMEPSGQKKNDEVEKHLGQRRGSRYNESSI